MSERLRDLLAPAGADLVLGDRLGRVDPGLLDDRVDWILALSVEVSGSICTRIALVPDVVTTGAAAALMPVPATALRRLSAVVLGHLARGQRDAVLRATGELDAAC